MRELLRNPLTEYARFLANWVACRLRFSHLSQQHLSLVLHSRLEPWVRIYDRAAVYSSSIGTGTYIGSRSVVANATIGRFCSIGPDCLIGPGRHPIDRVSTHPAFFSTRAQAGFTFADQDSFAESVPVRLGHDVWVGARAIILDGATIGDGAIVAAGAVVRGDVPPYAIVGGVPARILKRRFDDVTIARLLASRWWDRDLPWLRSNFRAFATPAALLAALEGEAAPSAP